MTQLWNPLTGVKTDAIIKYDKNGKAMEIRYKTGYVVKDESYIDDILFESGIIKQKSTSWQTI